MNSLLRKSARSSSRLARRSIRLRLEALEERLTPSTYTVTGDTAASAADVTLRYAITQAIQNQDQNAVIQFSSTLAGQTITLSAHDSNTSYGPTAFVINNANITIDASGSPGLVLSGGGLLRPFAVMNTGSLTLDNLTVADGMAQGGAGGSGSGAKGSGGGGAGLGGAVYNDGGDFRAEGVTFTNNNVQGGAGGSALKDAFSSIPGSGGAGDGRTGDFGSGGEGLGRTGGFGGGGGGNIGLSVIDEGRPTPGGGSIFGGGKGGAGSSKSVLGGGGGGGGGMGGALFSNGGVLTLVNDTFTANRAAGGAGGAGGNSVNTEHFLDPDWYRLDTIDMQHFKIADDGSSGSGYGGAIFVRNGTLTATGDTFSGNSAAQGGTDVYVLSDGSATPSQTAVTLVNDIANDILGQTNSPAANFVANSVNGGTPPKVS